METKLRIWRVVPTDKIGVQAPTYFVETQEVKLEKAEVEAMRLAKSKSALSKFDGWKFNLTKEEKRKDRFGRYIRYHQ
jgi:hypothetical protein